MRGGRKGSRMSDEKAKQHELPESEASLLQEFWWFIKHEKKWWLAPLLIVLVLVAALLVFSSSSPLAPFLYPLF